MLQFLRIENFLHVPHAEISFGEGLHCITGESGAGKTVILKGLKLLLGEKPPPGAVSERAETATIEAAFDIENQTAIHRLLDEAGLSFVKEEWLLIKRTIPHEGRSRLYVNSQNVNMSILEKLGELLVEIVDQHAGKQLLSNEYQRKLLDTFGSHSPLLKKYGEAYSNYLTSLEELSRLEQEQPDSPDLLSWQKNELEKHNVHQLDIDEQLTLHEKYSHAEEIADSLSQAVVTLREQIASHLVQMTRLIEKCAEKDPALTPAIEHLHTALLEIEEAASLGEQHLDSLNFDGEEFARLEELSNFLTVFKRKHGISYENITETYHDIVARLDRTLDREKHIKLQKEKIAAAKNALTHAAEQLTLARHKAAQTLSALTTKTLHMLKMGDTTFTIAFLKEECKKHGQDIISFELSRGKTSSSLRLVASGGELSRILLAIKSHIATKQSTPTLIFDEIDSNIGGETANVVATLLRQAAEAQQLLTITHFPQVAAKADHHIVVEKRDGAGTIRLLTPGEKKQELLRMVGGESSAALLR